MASEPTPAGQGERIIWRNEQRRLGDLVPWSINPRMIKEAQAERLAESFDEFGQVETLAVGPDNNDVYNGHQRLNVLMEQHGPDYVVDVRVSSRPLTEQERKKLTVYLHKGAAGEWDFDLLADNFEIPDLLSWGFEEWELSIDGFGNGAGESADSPTSEQARQTLAERFLIPPFSVLDARQGYWQERKRAWIALGIESEVGRGENALGMNLAIQPPGLSPTSVFDPVLCEIAYTWFTAPAAHILDPFAGGSVRGIVAAYLGRNYTGVDLRPEQIETNERQAVAIVPNNRPHWIVGNSLNALPAGEYDFIFSCPPYYDLEVYSDNPEDLSSYQDYHTFLADYRQIIAACIAQLRPDRFACFVVGDIRGRTGHCRNFVSDTIAAFQDTGAMLYNEAILVTAAGNLPVRVSGQFQGGRKLGKTHQNALVFVKGDWRKAAKWCGPVEVVELVGE